MKTTRTYLRFGTAPQEVTFHAGESEAITMLLEWPADLLIMDESSGLHPCLATLRATAILSP